MGTLLGQARGAINAFDPKAAGGSAAPNLLEALIMLVGTLTTLVYFQFSARSRPNQSPQRSPVIEIAARVGGVFISITLGALFAGVLTAALMALIERLDFIQTTLTTYLIK